jgi:hypothetical protein
MRRPWLHLGVTFKSIVAGSLHTRGITSDGGLRCWGDAPDGVQQPPEGAFTQVAVGAGACALRPGGAVVCWGALGWRDEPRPTRWH